MLKEKLQRILQEFRDVDPQAKRWDDVKVLEAMFSILAQQGGTRVTAAGRCPDGELIFRIRLTADGSDGVQQLV